MKLSMTFPLISFLLALATVTPSCAVCYDAVLDTDGKPLQPHTQYFIIPASGKNASGLVPASRDLLHICTLDVVQALLPSQPGLPVTLALSENRGSKTVNLLADLNIEFETPFWICPSSKVWQVDYSSSKRIVTTGGNVSNENSLFRIERYVSGKFYKLVQCLSSSTKCQDVGAFVGGLNIPRLALSNEPFSVTFRAVNSTSTVNRFERSGLRVFPFN